MNILEAPKWAVLLAGFVVGYFFHVSVLFVITAVAVLYAAFMVIVTSNKEIGALIGLATAGVTAYFLAAVWVTYLLTSNVSLGQLFKGLLR